MTETTAHTSYATAGIKLQLAFKEMASAGYVWEYEETPGVEISSYVDTVNPRSDAVGGEVTKVFELCAAEAGEYQIKFSYGRPFEAESEKEIMVNLKVYNPGEIHR